MTLTQHWVARPHGWRQTQPRIRRRCCSPAFTASDGSVCSSRAMCRGGRLTLNHPILRLFTSRIGTLVSVSTLIATLSPDKHCSRACPVGMQSYVHRVTAQPTRPARISPIPTSVLRRHPHKTSPAPAVFFLPHTILLHSPPKSIHSGFSYRST